MLGGLNCLRYLLKYDEGKRKPAVRAQDVHDILVPLFRGRTDAAKDEACKALRLLISDVSWTEAAAPAFENLGVGSGKLYALVNEMKAGLSIGMLIKVKLQVRVERHGCLTFDALLPP